MISGAHAPIRYVILHLPGPSWLSQVSVLDQPGVAEHLQYLTTAFRNGQIELAGPFLVDGAGGLLIMSASCTEMDARRLAQDDPGVKSGLIRAEVRPWMTTLGRTFTT